MNCLDCTLAGATTPAVATCHSCGAAVCADHAVIQPRYLQRVVPLNRLIPIEPPARVIACEVCAAAQDAVQHPEPAQHRHFHRRHAPAPEVAVLSARESTVAGGVLACVVTSDAPARRTEPRSVATMTAAGARLGVVRGHGTLPVHLHGATLGEQPLEQAAGPLDS